MEGASNESENNKPRGNSDHLVLCFCCGGDNGKRTDVSKQLVAPSIRLPICFKLLLSICDYGISHYTIAMDSVFRCQRLQETKAMATDFFCSPPQSRSDMSTQDRPSMWAFEYKTAATMAVRRYPSTSISSHSAFSTPDQWQLPTTPNPLRPTTTRLLQHIILPKSNEGTVSATNVGQLRTLPLPGFACAAAAYVCLSTFVTYLNIFAS